MREKEVEKILVAGVKNLGGRAYKWVSPGNAGVPDRIVLLPGMAPMFVELKSDAGKLSELQRMQIKRLRDMGQNTKVLCGRTETCAFLDDCKRRLSEAERRGCPPTMEG